MKSIYKKLFISSLFGVFGSAIIAQSPSDYLVGGVVNDAQLVREVMENKFPGYGTRVDEIFENSKSFSNKAGGELMVNLVVHVVWNSANPEENIDDSVIYNQVDILNADFARLNADTVNLRPIFYPIAGNPNIQFNLIDIVRVETSALFEATLDFQTFAMSMPDNVKESANGGSDAYNTSNYMNIWICQIQPLFGSPLLGYAYPPAGLSNWPAGQEAPSAELDGVVLDYRTIGSNNPVAYANPSGGNFEFWGRTAVHEVGHFLGLRHIWGDGGGFGGGDSCGADDGCADTPNQGMQSNFDCDTTQNTCIDSIAGQPDPNDLPDLIENYMDYSSEACSNMFSMDQVIIMRNVLQNERIGLLSDVTGVAEHGNLEMSVYPNPVNDVLTINVRNEFDEEGVIEVSDVLGRKVKSVNRLSGREIKLNMNGLTPGIYLVTYTTRGKKIDKKIILR